MKGPSLLYKTNWNVILLGPSLLSALSKVHFSRKPTSLFLSVRRTWWTVPRNRETLAALVEVQTMLFNMSSTIKESTLQRPIPT
ncbi:Cat38 [Halyomorpha halys]|nr:Cat38 [Halyomorpha halys]